MSRKAKEEEILRIAEGQKKADKLNEELEKFAEKYKDLPLITGSDSDGRGIL